ncbi:hypothetical protein DL98DRAFT_611756, partial [Cadophora sp. DSE1049]
TCLDFALQTSTCSATDQACVCVDTALNAQIAACIHSSCSVKEQLTTMNLTSIACSAPVRNKTKLYINVRIVFYTISTISIALRFMARFIRATPIWYDDWTMVLVFVCIFLPSELYITNSKHGIGQDIWKVPFDSITKILFIFWILESIYFVEVALVKIAFLLFYLRIFPDKKFRRGLWVLIVINAVTGVVFAIAICLVCKPISHAWNLWDMEHVGHCGNINALAFANAGVSIVLDVFTLILPLTQIWSLNLGLKKRIGIMLMFSVGAFVTVVSILRLKALVTFANTSNPTWDFFDAGLWSTIELDVGIICACMPAIRIILIRMFPRLGSTQTSTDIRQTIGKHSDAQLSKKGDVKSGISYSRNYGVEYAMKPAQDDSSFVQLVEIRAVGDESNN